MGGGRDESDDDVPICWVERKGGIGMAGAGISELVAVGGTMCCVGRGAGIGPGAGMVAVGASELVAAGAVR